MTPARPRAASLRLNDKSTIERSQGQQSRGREFAGREAQVPSPRSVVLLCCNLARPRGGASCAVRWPLQRANVLAAHAWELLA